MKKLKVIIAALLVLVVPLFIFVSTSHAGDFRSGNNAIVKKDEVIDHSLFITGNNVEVNGEVHGDIFCAGQNITINATVDGDVLCAGMNVRVSGTVDGNVRLAGQVVTLSGSVSRNASLAGSTITTDASSKVGRDLQTAGSTTTINGQVVRDADIAGDTVTVNSAVGRDISATTTNLTLGDGANVAGSLTYYSHNKLQKTGNAQISGQVTQKEPQEQPNQQKMNPVAAAFTGSMVFFVMLLILAMVVAALFPRMIRTVSDNAIEKPGTTVLIGLAACIVAPILIIGSFFTVVGALLGVTLLLFWLVVMLLSGVFFSYYIGRLALSRTVQHPLLAMFVGVLIVAILMLVPIVNFITLLAISLFGSGMVVRELLKRTPKPVYAIASTSSRKK